MKGLTLWRVVVVLMASVLLVAGVSLLEQHALIPHGVSLTLAKALLALVELLLRVPRQFELYWNSPA